MDYGFICIFHIIILLILTLVFRIFVVVLVIFQLMNIKILIC